MCCTRRTCVRIGYTYIIDYFSWETIFCSTQRGYEDTDKKIVEGKFEEMNIVIQELKEKNVTLKD